MRRSESQPLQNDEILNLGLTNPNSSDAFLESESELDHLDYDSPPFMGRSPSSSIHLSSRDINPIRAPPMPDIQNSKQPHSNTKVNMRAKKEYNFSKMSRTLDGINDSTDQSLSSMLKVKSPLHRILNKPDSILHTEYLNINSTSRQRRKRKKNGDKSTRIAPRKLWNKKGSSPLVKKFSKILKKGNYKKSSSTDKPSNILLTDQIISKNLQIPNYFYSNQRKNRSLPQVSMTKTSKSKTGLGSIQKELFDLYTRSKISKNSQESSLQKFLATNRSFLSSKDQISEWQKPQMNIFDEKKSLKNSGVSQDSKERSNMNSKLFKGM